MFGMVQPALPSGVLTRAMLPDADAVTTTAGPSARAEALMFPVCQRRRVALTPLVLCAWLATLSWSVAETVSVLSAFANEPGVEVERSPVTATL